MIHNQVMQICWFERRETFVLIPLSFTDSEAQDISQPEIKAYTFLQPECKNLIIGFHQPPLIYLFQLKNRLKLQENK